MKKTFLFLAALAMSAMTMAAEKTLTFNLSKNPGGWPTANSTELTEYIYTLDDVDYSFYLKNVKSNNSYLMLTQPAALGLPDIEGYKLTKVVAKNSSGCSTSTKVGVSYSDESADYLPGGEVQTWSTQSSSYTYTLTATTDNVVYYLYVTNKNAQVTELALTYEETDAPQRVLESIYIDGTATKLEYIEGESFETDGLKVMGKYADELGDSEITGGIEWTIVPGTLALGTTSVTVTATAGGKTSDPVTVDNIVVKQFVKTYANTYMSENVVLTTEGGANASLAKVVIDEVEFDAIKAGSSSKAGVCVLTIPAATKTLHFHAAGWKDKNVTLDVNGTEYTLVADAGVTNSSPFTLQNDPETQDYFTLDPKGATTITFTATANYRFVLFGVNAELQEGVVAAPTFTPSDGYFDQEVNVTLTAEEGAEIFYALNEAVTADNAIKYTEPIELIETVTIYAIAKKDGKESAPASKTYTLVPAYTLAELVAAGAPTDNKKKVVLVLENAEITELDAKSEDKGGDVRGLSFMSGAQKVVLFQQQYAFPKTWAVGGTVSGRVMGDWVLFNNSIWELMITPEEVNNLSYTKPTSTALDVTSTEVVTDKVLRDGQLYILRNGVMYDVAGHVVK